MMIRGSVVCIALLASGCSEGKSSEATAPSSPAISPTTEIATTTPTGEEPVTETQETRTLRFADGSGNQYLFTSVAGAGTLVYTPVTPENSSSGTYSGGDPANVNFSAEKNTELWEKVDALRADSDVHAGARAMGTGSFQIAGPGQEARFLVKMGPMLTAFTEFVEGLRKP